MLIAGPRENMSFLILPASIFVGRLYIPLCSGDWNSPKIVLVYVMSKDLGRSLNTCLPELYVTKGRRVTV